MRGYGLPRIKDVEWPDKADIRLYGLNVGKLKPAAKAISRRIWKKRERQIAKNNIKGEVDQ